jgi:hypothetical protein
VRHGPKDNRRHPGTTSTARPARVRHPGPQPNGAVQGPPLRRHHLPSQWCRHPKPHRGRTRGQSSQAGTHGPHQKEVWPPAQPPRPKDPGSCPKTMKTEPVGPWLLSHCLREGMPKPGRTTGQEHMQRPDRPTNRCRGCLDLLPHTAHTHPFATALGQSGASYLYHATAMLGQRGSKEPPQR